MWVGIGVGIGRNRFATGIFNDYALRVNADGGITEAGQCVDAVTGLLLNASLLLIPSGYKGGKLYAEIPTNGNGDLTWTRGSDAFRTNASGVLQRVPWNLVGYSEDFTNSFWKIGGITTSVTANTTNAPNGTLTADTALVNGTYVYAGRGIVFQLNVGASYTLSLYVKKSSISSADNVRLTVNNTSSWTGASTQKVALTNDWQRVTLTWTANNTQAYFIVGSVDNTGATDSTCYGNMDIWGAQFVEGTTAQTYLPTTDRLNFPRLSYMYGSCPSALLEPQRTNLALYSEQFDNASWNKSGTTITANTTTSPDGSTNADTLTATATTGVHGLFNTTAYTISSIAPLSFTCYAKKGNVDYLVINHFDGTAYYTWFNLSNGTIGTTASGVTATIQSVGNGWYRCTCVRTPSLIFNLYMGFYLSNANNTITYTATGNEFIYLYGAQAEVGAYPTTYIPTTSATATRVADSFSRNNIYTNGLISASGGTWFVELRNNVAYTRDGGSTSLAVSTTSTDVFASSTGIEILNNGGLNRLSIIKRISGTATSLYLTTTDTVKIAVKWNGTSADVFVNGTKQVSATAFTTTNMEFIKAFGNDVPKFIQQMALFSTPLSDTDCAAITSL